MSFLELVEVVVVTEFRRSQPWITLERLRRAHAFVGNRFRTPHPFASRMLRDVGGRVLRDFEELDPSGPALVWDVGGRFALPDVVGQTLDRFDFSAEDSLADRWFPAGRDVPIVVDPGIGAGRPTLLGSGVTVETVYRRFQAGESVEFLASDYDLDQVAIQAAIGYADRHSSAA